MITLRPDTCINLNQSVIKFCLPEQIECGVQPKNGRFTDIPWNCERPCPQLNGKYYQPFKTGDKIQLQTLFYSGRPTNPTPYDDIIGVELCSPDGEGTIDAAICRKMSAWKNKKPYQILELNTDELPSCFSVQFTNLVTGEICKLQEFRNICQCPEVKANTEIVTFNTGTKTNCGCKETVLIQSKRTSRDCFGYCYGEPDEYVGDLIEYNNELRFCGWIKDLGCSNTIERIERDGSIKSEEIRSTYQLGFNKMAPWAKNVLCDQLLSGGEICINGEDYYTDGYDVTNNVTSGHMWQFSITVYKVCNNANINCI